MKRKEFLRQLKEELRKRRDIESEEVLFYYDELIQDAVDSGESEDIFIANLGSIKEIVRRLEDDDEFISEVKGQNEDIVKNVLGTSVKVIGYFILGLAAFVIGISSISIFISGIAVIIAAIVKIIFQGSTDVYGYLALMGVLLIGVSLAVFSIAVVKWFLERAKPALLTIFRNTKDFLNRKGKE